MKKENLMNKNESVSDMTQSDREEKYVEDVKGIYNIIGLALLTLSVPVILAFNDSSLWSVVGWLLLTWLIVLGINIFTEFDLFGEKWKKRSLESA
jgi:hypothetical protein